MEPRHDDGSSLRDVSGQFGRTHPANLLFRVCYGSCRFHVELHFFFFFQAEDGIRDLTVTGVQTCALPILQRRAARAGVPDELAGLEEDPGLTGADGDLGRELFRLVTKAREAGRDPEMEMRAAARRYRGLVRAWGRS